MSKTIQLEKPRVRLERWQHVSVVRRLQRERDQAAKAHDERPRPCLQADEEALWENVLNANGRLSRALKDLWSILARLKGGEK